MNFPHVVAIRPFSARDRYNDITYGTYFTTEARVMGTTRRVLTNTGEDVQANFRVVMPGDVSVSVDDKIILQRFLLGYDYPEAFPSSLTAEQLKLAQPIISEPKVPSRRFGEIIQKVVYL